MEGQNKGLASIGNPLATLTANLNIRGKLLVGFLVIIAFTLVVVIIAFINQRIMNRTVDEMLNVHNKTAQMSLEAETLLKLMESEDKNFRLNYQQLGLQAAKEKHLAKFLAVGGETYDKLYSLSQIVSNQQQKDQVLKALDALNNYSASFVAMVNTLDQRFDPEFGELTKVNKALSSIEQTVELPGVSPQAAILYHHLESPYQRYLLASTKENAAQTNEAVVEYLANMQTMNLPVEQKTMLLAEGEEFQKWFTNILKTDENINAQVAAYEVSASQVTPTLTQVRSTALASQQSFVGRLNTIEKTVLFTVIGVGILALIVGVLVALGLSKGLTRQVDRIMELLGEMGMGNFSARSEVVSTDELGEMATSLNAMLDNMTTLIQSQDERDSIQESIMKLMGEISDLTEGDLTARAEVTEDITGAIADSFNTMAEQFGGIVQQVKTATFSVDETAADVAKLTSELATKSLEQNQQVNEAIESIYSIAQSIHQVSENAAKSAEVSLASRLNAREGAEAVEKTNLAMEGIREQINETARSIKRLGESSMEIGNVVEIINNIADRTSILALNASIQAAMAGDAGHGFAVVAEEVQRLAESSSNSTKQIDALVKSIQAEIKDVSNRMDESISKVVQGSQLADGAYAKLHEIESVSNQLADLIESITQASAEQVRMSEAVVGSMVAVGEVSTATAQSSQETAQLMNMLNDTARNLREAVDAFKIESSAEQQFI